MATKTDKTEIQNGPDQGAEAPEVQKDVASEGAGMVDAVKAELDKLIAEAKAEAQKIIDEAVSKAAEVAATNGEQAPTDYPKSNDDLESYVTVKLFKDNDKYSEPVLVGLNGEQIMIQRGVEVKIKKKFALVLEESDAQKNLAMAYMDGLENEYNTRAKDALE